TYAPTTDDYAYDAYDELGPEYVDIATPPAGSAVPDVTIFWNQLDPYGDWYDDPEYGYVFAPARADYVPYTNGYWAYTDYGLTWVSGDPFGWATDHYGRWIWRGRWVWRPDTRWG